MPAEVVGSCFNENFNAKVLSINHSQNTQQYSPSGRIDVILRLHETFWQQLAPEELKQNLQNVPPAVAQDVAVLVRQGEDGLGRKLGLRIGT